MDGNELVRGCNEWQLCNMISGSWTKKLKNELDKIGLGYIGHRP